jgi:hypothetical protein
MVAAAVVDEATVVVAVDVAAVVVVTGPEATMRLWAVVVAGKSGTSLFEIARGLRYSFLSRRGVRLECVYWLHSLYEQLRSRCQQGSAAVLDLISE